MERSEFDGDGDGAREQAPVRVATRAQFDEAVGELFRTGQPIEAPSLEMLAEVGVRGQGVRLFFVGGPISLSGGGEAGGNWIRQGVVRSGGGSGGRRYFCRQRPMGDFRWSSRAS